MNPNTPDELVVGPRPRFLLLAQCRRLGLTPFDRPSWTYFLRTIRGAVDHRREHSYRRNDFVDHILDALKDKASEAASEPSEEGQFEKDASLTAADADAVALSEKEIERDMVANCLLFFFAGLETQSTVLAALLLNLANHQDHQEALYQEIRDVSRAQGFPGAIYWGF